MTDPFDPNRTVLDFPIVMGRGETGRLLVPLHMLESVSSDVNAPSRCIVSVGNVASFEAAVDPAKVAECLVELGWTRIDVKTFVDTKRERDAARQAKAPVGLGSARPEAERKVEKKGS